LLKIINKALTGIKSVWFSVREINIKGLFKNPLFYFGLASFVLFGTIYASCDSSANTGNLSGSRVVFFNSFFNKSNNLSRDSLFSSRVNAIPLETPDLKILQGNTLGGVSAPQVVSGKVLGDVFGGNNQSQKEVVDYTVQAGDTLQSIANTYKISLNTLLWANNIISSSTIKVGQSLIVLPVDGVLHVVKSGDTISGIVQTYKSQQKDVIAFNNLANQGDIYIGDILVVPGGIMPKKAAPTVSQVPLADNYFIFPTQGKITQGLHYYNAVDVANTCGTPVRAAAAGTVQRAVGNGAWNGGMGNYITILHANGTVTYYGHLGTVFVIPGEKVNIGDKIGLIGNTGKVVGVTGCHLHFQVMGAKNPLSNYLVGAKISY